MEEKNISLEEFLYECLLSHLYAEYYHRIDDWGRMLMVETYEANSTEAEKEYFLFPNYDKITTNILDIINAVKPEDRYGTIAYNLNNALFDTIEIDFIYQKHTVAAFYPTTSFISNGKFSKLNIGVNPEKATFNDILHELLHAYQYLKVEESGKSFRGFNYKTGYYTLNNHINSTDEGEQSIANTFYYLNTFEKGAYLGSIMASAMTTSKEFKSLRDIADYIKSLEPYQKYVILMESINAVLNAHERGISKEQKIILLDAINRYSGRNFETYDKFIYFLKKARYNLLRKMNQIYSIIAMKKLNTKKYHPGIGPSPTFESKMNILDIINRQKYIRENIARIK